VLSAVEVQGVRALRERAGRHRGDAAAPRGEAGLAALCPRPPRERRHRVRLQWRLRVRIPPDSGTAPSHIMSNNVFLCEKNRSF